MNNITCIITDDEPFARKGLQGYIEKIGFLELKGVCEDALQLSDMLLRQPVDLLFLDIQMPHITGVEFIRALSKPPKVIFTTAYEHYALQGFELDVLDYLLKPISYERFLKAAWKARDYFALRRNPAPAVASLANSYIFIKANGKLEKINFDEILFIEGMENYVAIYLPGRKLITHSTIKSLFEKLPHGQFIQTHKSFIVAINKVETIEGNTLHIQEYQVPVSKYLRETVLPQIVK
ncbi:LytTR family DNA-binding domain-containing protein [Mucilaginibacter sp. L3T2-6]|uniref:LytR/AlgR family response regulator transcription factor n=1 Tax=Mucilaginibacter sp. L3T2-6 TaxID=3062491 RepID=UPI00267662C2|nr:LytTR family DNA-binding domain-containing protein [Mucilaginibacter sp. L3T2-6]MDO3641710.1 LytTR family DNA-binding domain-containing protein [Mucilaginibacter sp. L3T2-6]MDV6214204.1 LytTR family DNA-binding domain-containing protein [Mucilaginibacter sp. L3T2-6]